MKKILNKITTILLSGLLLSSCVMTAVGCNQDKKPADNNGNSVQIGENFTDGTHQGDYKDTDKILSSNGVTEYAIVMPKNAGEYVDFAAKELNLLFYEATGSRLRILTDDAVAYSETAKYFVLGKNALYDAAGISTEGLNLDRNGYMIKTVGDSIFITGDYDDGTMFGVYGYLELEFGFECFSNTSYVIEKRSEVTLRNYNVVDIPDIKVRSSGNSFITSDKTALRRMRFTPRDKEIFLGSPSAHTVFTHLPPTVYNNSDVVETYHPKWYASNGMQLCYTAHGDQEELVAMKTAAMEVMITELKRNKQGYIFVFSQEDKETWCNCDTCTESKTKYGADSAVVIKFINSLCEMVEAWMETDEGLPYKRDFIITFLAYHFSLQAPTKYDEATNSYQPIDDSVLCHDRASVMFAPIYMDFQQSLYADVNKSTYNAFQGWKNICKRFNIYTYQTNYGNFMLPYDVFNQIQDFYTYAATANTYWIFDLGQRNQAAGATGWQVFKSYVSAKLSWNVNLNMEDLTNTFFEGYFGPASDSMLKFWRSYRVHSQYLIENYLGGSRSVYAPLLKAEYWPRNMLSVWLSYVDEALAAIKHLKTVDPELYQSYYDHITMERVSLYYAMVELHESTFDSAFINKIKLECKEDCTRLGISVTAEGNRGSTVGVLWQQWGIA